MLTPIGSYGRRFLLPAIFVAISSLRLSAQPAGAGPEAITKTMERLGIQVPLDVIEQYAVRKPLEELSRERCDQQAIVYLGKALDVAGYRREAANAHESFSDSCGGQSSSLRAAVNILLKLSDYRGAVRISSKLIQLEPFNDNGYYLRALGYDQGAVPKKAIDDYVTAIELFEDKSKIANASYYALARNYDKLGQYCDAALAIAAWVALNPAQHDTSQTRSMISNYNAKGACPVSRTTG
jgi:tetratricopeptide (TPR) repeat protein